MPLEGGKNLILGICVFKDLGILEYIIYQNDSRMKIVSV